MFFPCYRDRSRTVVRRFREIRAPETGIDEHLKRIWKYEGNCRNKSAVEKLQGIRNSIYLDLRAIRVSFSLSFIALLGVIDGDVIVNHFVLISRTISPGNRAGEWVVWMQSLIDRANRYGENVRTKWDTYACVCMYMYEHITNYLEDGKLPRIYVDTQIQMLIQTQYRSRWAWLTSFRELLLSVPSIRLMMPCVVCITGIHVRVKARKRLRISRSPSPYFLHRNTHVTLSSLPHFIVQPSRVPPSEYHDSSRYRSAELESAE